MSFAFEIAYGRQRIMRGKRELSFQEVDLLAKYTKSRPFYRNRNTYVPLTADNFEFWRQKALENHLRKHGGVGNTFVFKIFLKMLLVRSQQVFPKLRRPYNGLTHELEFSFAESELPYFLEAMNLQ